METEWVTYRACGTTRTTRQESGSLDDLLQVDEGSGRSLEGEMKKDKRRRQAMDAVGLNTKPIECVT